MDVLCGGRRFRTSSRLYTTNIDKKKGDTDRTDKESEPEPSFTRLRVSEDLGKGGVNGRVERTGGDGAPRKVDSVHHGEILHHVEVVYGCRMKNTGGAGDV